MIEGYTCSYCGNPVYVHFILHLTFNSYYAAVKIVKLLELLILLLLLLSYY